MKRIPLFLGLLLLFVTTGPLFAAGQRWALLIGVDKCKALGELKVCAADARALQALLPRVGYATDHILVLADDTAELSNWPTFGNVQRTVQRIAKIAAPDDSILMFFSGHGITRDNEGYLVPSDGDAKQAVPLAWVKEQLRASKAKEKVLILDACHSGAAKGVTGIVPSLAATPDLVMLLSCDRDEVSWPDDTTGRSVFTGALLDGLSGKAAGPDRKVTATRLHEYVSQRVKTWTFRNNKDLQSPLLVGTPDAALVLAACPPNDLESVSTPATATPPPAPAVPAPAQLAMAGKAAGPAPALAPVAESAKPVAAVAVDPGQAKLAAILDQVTADLCAQKFNDALRHWQAGRDAPELKPLAEQVTVAGKVIESVARMPQRILDSLNADTGKTVTVELLSGKVAVEIREVVGTTIKAMVAVGNGKMGRTFTFGDLSLNERLKRLGSGDTPELLVMRGILMLEAERADSAGKFFAQAGGPLAEAFKRELARRAATATDTQAEVALKELLRAIAKSTASMESEALIASIRAKCTNLDQVNRAKERVAAFAKTYGGSVVGKQYLPIIEKALTCPLTALDWTVPEVEMEFVWIAALKCWVGKYEVTNGEYRKFKADHDSQDYNGNSLNGERQPVVYVNFDDANEYAAWLTERERTAGRLPDGMKYRLPTKDEWLTVAQCGDGREYPWGNDWPPKYGNYSDQSSACKDKIAGYTDGFAVTCPVEKSGKNEWGLYGVGGNVTECTSASPGGAFDACRGASWGNEGQDCLRCDYRVRDNAARLHYGLGFRLVLSR